MFNLHINKPVVRFPDSRKCRSPGLFYPRKLERVLTLPLVPITGLVLKRPVGRESDMNKLIGLITIGITLALTVGCANGPLQNFFQGAPCNSCQPALQPSTGSHALGTCTDGCATSSAIPEQIIQPTGSGINGPIAPLESSYYSQNDPTTQSYQHQPYAEPAQPIYGNIPSSGTGGHSFGSGSSNNVGQGLGGGFGSGSSNNALTPPSLNFSVN